MTNSGLAILSSLLLLTTACSRTDSASDSARDSATVAATPATKAGRRVLSSDVVALNAKATGRLAAAAVVKDGWWIRVNTSKTEANGIVFLIGTDGSNRQPWLTWHSGDPAEFDVPSTYRNVAALYIHATANPEDKNVWFCMMYRGDGVKHLDFDDSEEQKKNQSDRDDECR